MTRRLHKEEGWLVVTAVFVMTLMMGFGLATLSFVDDQTRQSRVERESESSFNHSEGALNAQTFILGQAWPQRSSGAYPPECTSAMVSNRKCPSASALRENFDKESNPDFDPAKTGWSTRVRDNGTDCTPSRSEVSYFYNPAVTEACSSRITWDANADGQIWVRSQSLVRGRRRTLVALIRVEPKPISFPQFAVNVGSFGTTNSGQHNIIDATGSLGIAVRCDLSDPNNGPGSDCQDYDPKKANQVIPLPVVGNDDETALSDSEMKALEQYAKLNGTYYTSCPTGWNPNGAVVVVESGNCKIGTNSPAAPGQASCCNSQTEPGVLIVKSGTLELGGNVTFYGIIYMRNRRPDGSKWLADSPDDPPILVIGGTPTVEGGVAVDGPYGRLEVGSSGGSGRNQKPNIKFDPNAFTAISAAGTAGIVQNSWRETVD